MSGISFRFVVQLQKSHNSMARIQHPQIILQKNFITDCPRLQEELL